VQQGCVTLRLIRNAMSTDDNDLLLTHAGA
jgi:hypothetical protein